MEFREPTQDELSNIERLQRSPQVYFSELEPSLFEDLTFCVNAVFPQYIGERLMQTGDFTVWANRIKRFGVAVF